VYMVTTEGTTFFYLTGFDDESSIDSSGLFVTIQDRAAFSRVRQLCDVRAAVFESMLRRGRGNVYYLYWRDNRDLSELDQRVGTSSYTDEDFVTSVKTIYQNTLCDRCRASWNTLVIPPGDPYPGAPGLLEKKISSSKFVPCPRCGASLRQMVVKIFGEVA
jgi:hypothetical protein